MPKGSKVVFLTSWALVFLSVDRHPTATVREIASVIGITDRQVHRVLGDLEAEGYITRTRVGRRNHYTVNKGRPHGANQDVERLLSLLTG